jgi:hypothetical protein
MNRLIHGNRRHVGRHRRTAAPGLTLTAIRDRWHDDLWRHLDDGRSPADAAALARIDLIDRVQLVVAR